MNPFACLFKNKREGEREREREKRMLKYGARLTQEIIAACDGNICYPINIFSANEIREAMDGVFHRDVRAHSIKLWATHKDRQIFMKYHSTNNSIRDEDYFFTEISTVLQLNHVNVVKLLGCCIEMESPILIYEVFPYSLDDLLRQPNPQAPLAWENRLRIAIEIADAITYMHIAKPKTIIHRDVKSSNILLDKHYRPKLCNFNLSIAIPLGETHVETLDVDGTIGYLDPHYLRTCTVTERADVYGFGWILLELLTGKGPHELLPEVEANFILDSHLMSTTDEKTVEQLKACLDVSLRCINDKPDQRPAMKQVSEQLRLIERYQHPLLPPPFSSSF